MKKFNLLWVVMILSVAGCGDSAEVSSYDENNTTKITVLPSLQQCETDDDCMLVPADCNFCCNEVAINKEFEAFYTSEKDMLCEKSKTSAVCTCMSLIKGAACIENICTPQTMSLIKEN